VRQQLLPSHLNLPLCGSLLARASADPLSPADAPAAALRVQQTPLVFAYLAVSWASMISDLRKRARKSRFQLLLRHLSHPLVASWPCACLAICRGSLCIQRHNGPGSPPRFLARVSVNLKQKEAGQSREDGCRAEISLIRLCRASWFFRVKHRGKVSDFPQAFSILRDAGQPSP